MSSWKGRLDELMALAVAAIAVPPSTQIVGTTLPAIWCDSLGVTLVAVSNQSAEMACHFIPSLRAAVILQRCANADPKKTAEYAAAQAALLVDAEAVANAILGSCTYELAGDIIFDSSAASETADVIAFKMLVNIL